VSVFAFAASLSVDGFPRSQKDAIDVDNAADFIAMAEKIIEEQPLKVRLFVDMQIVGKLPRDDQVSVPMLEMALHDLCCCTHYRQTKRLVKKKLGTL